MEEIDVTAAQLKARARELGFDLCGIARAHPLSPEPLDRWLARGWDAELSYVRARREERLDPSRLVPGARSVIVVAASYAPAAHPRYVVVVLIEHGGFGAQAAAPAAKEIYQALFHVR